MQGASALADRVLVSHTASALVATLNRPRVLNALSTSTLHQLHQAVTTAGPRTFILQGTGKAFCAGGDIITLGTQPQTCSAFFPAEFALQKYMYDQVHYSVVLMKGATIGGGAGLSIVCKARVATQTTQWAFPETIIGFVPTVGANYLLPRLSSRAVGLYLALTGDKANGADCFYLGIATHYTHDEELPRLLHDLGESSNPAETVLRYHHLPDPSLCKVLQHQAEIEACFSNVSSVSEILSRLQGHQSSWAAETLSTLRFVCPLAVEVAFRQFQVGSELSYQACLAFELPILLHMTTVQNSNFLLGVRHRLVTKSKSRADWSPASFSEVTEAQVAECLLAHSKTIERL